jgi:uncharacterized membrane protein YhaH (DUF805 family)
MIGAPGLILLVLIAAPLALAVSYLINQDGKGGVAGDFVKSVKTCFAKYGSFDGRASRSEFWWFQLFILVYMIVVLIVGALIVDILDSDEGEVLMALIILASFLLLMIPYVAVSSRRLHDMGLSGWLQLVQLIPFGQIVLIVFFARIGQAGPNIYGPDPLGRDPTPTP